MAEENEIGFFERMGLQMGLTKVFGAVSGYKTYILAGVGIVVALVGHFWGPVTVAGTTIPSQSWQDVWKVVYASGIVSTLRHGIQKSEDAAATPPKGA